ncbi:MAG: uracil-DNA glycosylase [Planctomycetota bacterium]
MSRESSPTPGSGREEDRSAVRHSLSLHLEGLRTWKVDRIFGEPVVIPRSPASAEEPSRRSLEARTTTAEPPRPSAVPPAPPIGPGENPPIDPAELLAAVAREAEACRRCRLGGERNRCVPGAGDPRAPLLFVGEAPGREEDRRGEPFVGAAGQLLDRIVGALGFRREEVFIANTLKCRPPNNRDPLPDEWGACSPFLERQVAALSPRMIVALGRAAARLLTGRDEPLGRLRGGKHAYHGIPVIVTYHPAYLLREPSAKRDCWQDLQPVVQEFGRPPLPQE